MISLNHMPTSCQKHLDVQLFLSKLRHLAGCKAGKNCHVKQARTWQDLPTAKEKETVRLAVLCTRTVWSELAGEGFNGFKVLYEQLIAKVSSHLQSRRYVAAVTCGPWLLNEHRPTAFRHWVSRR